MKNRIRLPGMLLVLALIMLACNVAQPSSTPDTGLLQTQTSMAMTLTAMNNVQPTVVVQPTVHVLPTARTQPTLHVQPPANIQPTDTLQPAANSALSPEQVKAKIDSSNILIYEDMAAYPDYLPVVSRAISHVGGTHVYVADAMGTLMDKLDSATKWDLIIIAAEAKSSISGDYWTAIKDHVDNDHSALIAEVWNLDKIGGGKVSPLLQECGIEVQKNWTRSDAFNSIDFPVFWVESTSPVFNTPNVVDSFKASDQSDVWTGDIGDLMQLTGDGDAKILGSKLKGDQSDNGLLTSCIKGTFLLQTFSTHDYPSDKMIALWQNYINFTLTNHFTNKP